MSNGNSLSQLLTEGMAARQNRHNAALLRLQNEEHECKTFNNCAVVTSSLCRLQLCPGIPRGSTSSAQMCRAAQEASRAPVNLAVSELTAKGARQAPCGRAPSLSAFSVSPALWSRGHPCRLTSSAKHRHVLHLRAPMLTAQFNRS